MKLDEAIKKYTDSANYQRAIGNLPMCSELKQLVKWLEELRARRRMYHKEHTDDCLRDSKTKCKWIKYDYRTICPKDHDIDNPYWRLPENRMDVLKYCPYCGKEIEVVK